MKYYVYVSDTKLEMLFSQIEKSDNQQREASLGFDLAVIKGELKESRGIPVNKFSKLEKIISVLEKENLVGSVYDDAPYIKGVYEMTWASFGFSKESPITFWGCIINRIFLGLAGSRHHLMGEQSEGKAHSHSITPSITRWLLDEFGDIPLEIREQYRYSQECPEPLSNFDIENAVSLAVMQMSGQKSIFEFTSKVLYRKNDVILATPLYVALSE